MLIALAAAAVVPALMLMWFFHAMDVFREPPRVLWLTFGFGVLTIPGVLAVALPVMHVSGIEQLGEPFVKGTLDAFVGAAIPEELFKFLVLYAYAYRHKEFDEPMDGIVYGAAASLGFATLENVLYVTGGGVGTAILRALTAVPGHASSGAIMGYFIGQAKFRPEARTKLFVAALFFPILLHGLYDAPLLILKAFGELEREPGAAAAGLLLFWLVAFLFEVIWALRLTRRVRKQQKAMQPAPARPGAPMAVAAAMGPMPGVPMPMPAMPMNMAAPPAYAQAAYAQAPYAAPYAPALGPRPSRVKGVLLLLLGVVLGGAGGLMCLGFALVLATGSADDKLAATIIVGLIIGVLPLALGLLAFGFGIRALNRASQPQAVAWSR